MLSTRLGYGLPAFFALRLAEAFCLALSFLAARFFPFGFALFQGADSFFFAIGYVQSIVSRDVAITVRARVRFDSRHLLRYSL